MPAIRVRARLLPAAEAHATVSSCWSDPSHLLRERSADIALPLAPNLVKHTLLTHIILGVRAYIKRGELAKITSPSKASSSIPRTY